MAKIVVVPSPIGNLDDISTRVLATLSQVDAAIVEDTRVARRLFAATGLRVPRRVWAVHDHNERREVARVIDAIRADDLTAALLTDAGTPTVADPGYRIIDAAHEAGISVTALPGPCAVTTALAASGLAANRWMMVGFLPVRAGALQSEVESWRGLGSGSIVAFVPARRLGTALDAIATAHPAGRVVVARELTKVHEEIVRLPMGRAMEWWDAQPEIKKRGEVTLVVEPAWADLRVQGLSRNEAYALALAQRKETSENR